MIAKDISDQKKVENHMINYKKNLEKTVKDKTKELNNLLVERDLLLEEIHHRVKNNLQIITSLIDLQCDSEEPKEQCVFFETLKNRIYIMSLLHEQLYKSKDFKYVHLGDYLKGIVDNLERSLVDKSKKIFITLCETEEHIDLKKAISCGLIINELVSNAMKHAFPDGREGHITVNVSSTKDEYTIDIEDDGIGISQDNMEDRMSSLGLQLVNMLIRQLNGLINVHSSNGTKINMRFPK